MRPSDARGAIIETNLTKCPCRKRQQRSQSVSVRRRNDHETQFCTDGTKRNLLDTVISGLGATTSPPEQGARRIATPHYEAHGSFRSWFVENRDEKRGTTPHCSAAQSRATRGAHRVREAIP